MVTHPHPQPRDAVSRLLLAVGSVSLGAGISQGVLHLVAPHLFEPAPEFSSAGFVLLLARSLYDWLRRRDEALLDSPPERTPR